jgi:arsenite-transporting ATPase
MRILLFSGKGGVGKTSLAAATGVRLSQLGYRTLVMSVDPAHSLGDAFDIGPDLFDGRTAEPLRIQDRLAIQEVNIQAEIKRHWGEIATYITSVLRTTGVGDIQAQELAILPGMEELSALMYVNEYRREDRYDVVILDCAPTAESVRFISMPTTLDWYMKHIFSFQRSLLKAVRPLAKRLAPVDLPPDSYFGNIEDLFLKLHGIEESLQDPRMTSVRLVTNPEQMVLRETQRAYVYFSLHGLTVDTIIANRVLPDTVQDGFFRDWRENQGRILREMEDYFTPVPVKRVPLMANEVLSVKRLEDVAALLYPEGEDPAKALVLERPYTFSQVEDRYEVRLQLPFATKEEVSVFKKADELVVEIGSLRRHIGLPTSMTGLSPTRARLDNRILTVEMKETP